MSLRSRWIVIALVAAGMLYLLVPTLRYAFERPDDIAAAEGLKRHAIGLGLDLQGGIHLALEVDETRFRRDLAVREARSLQEALERKGVHVLAAGPLGDGIEVVVPADVLDEAIRAEAGERPLLGRPTLEAIEGAPDRKRYRISIDRAAYEEKIREATGRALEILRNRVDAFGVAEPVIQQVGDRRIVVELPGVTDPARAKSLVGRTAVLGFHVVRDDLSLEEVIRKMDAAVGGGLLQRVRVAPGSDPRSYFVWAEDEDFVRDAIEKPAAEALLPPGTRFAFGAGDERGGRRVVPLHLIGAEAEMTGENLETANVGFDQFGKPAIYFRFNSEGARRFGEVSGANVGKRLAIVLDGRVQSAPTIRDRITASGEITGHFSQEEARELAIVLEAGTLPAPLTLLAERTVGPSLGRDSIRLGLRATAMAVVLVAIFMIVRYKAAGVAAVVGMAFLLVGLLASLAFLGAVLTLPGIAGIALTIGMAVDANVLIFERIREELRAGRTFRPAFEAGYDRAFSAIVDANLTTLLAALALYWWGTGPIRGFAVTLAAGIVWSFFAAIFLTRTIIETILARGAARVSL